MVGGNMRQRIILIGLLVLLPSLVFAQPLAVGPSIGDELRAAGLVDLPFSWNPQTGQVRVDDPRLTDAQRTAILAVFAAHNPVKLSAEQLAKQTKEKARTDMIAHCTNIEADTAQPMNLRKLCNLLKQVVP